MTGVLGFDPGPYSLRELVWMRQAKGFAEWDLGLTVASIVASAIPRFGKGKSITDFISMNPFREQREPMTSNRGIPLRGEIGRAVLNALSKPEKPNHG